MAVIFSTYEAKARFSEVLRLVRQGETVRISYRGTPVAEVRPLSAKAESLTQRMTRLEREGRVVAARGEGGFAPVQRRAGALNRFLAARGE
jgi:prevent-host-death family protein